MKFYAKKYLEYKLRNKTINDLSTTGKKRVEFCKTILKSLNELDDKYELKVNQPAVDLQEPGLNKQNDIQNQDFQDEIKDNLEKEIIEDNKEIIEIKDDLNKENIIETKEIIEIKKDEEVNEKNNNIEIK